MENSKLKTVARFNEPMAAKITAAMLNDNGIPAAVFGEVSAYPSLGYASGIEVKVNEENYDEAMSLLAAADKAE